MERRIIAVSGIIAFLLSSCAVSSPARGERGEGTQARSTQVQVEEPQSERSVQRETLSEPESQTIRIEVIWESPYELDVSLRGEAEDGEMILVSKDDTEVRDQEGDLVAEVEFESKQSKHRVTFGVHKLDTHLELEAVNGAENQMPEYIEANVFLIGSDSPVHFDNQDAEGTYRSYTGVWFWAPFGLDHGKLVDYDASWIETGRRGQQPEVGEADNPSDEDDLRARNQLEQTGGYGMDRRGQAQL